MTIVPGDGPRPSIRRTAGPLDWSLLAAEVQEVQLAAITNYLRTSGWTIQDQDDRTTLWAIERSPTVPDVRLVLPASEDAQDYAERLWEVIRALSNVERRVAREILDDVTVGASDNVSVRLTPSTPPGEAPLDLAESAISALRNYVVGSASSLHNRALVLPSRRPNRAVEYGSEARFSTGSGSFILNLALPLGTDIAGEDVDGNEPLADLPAIPYGRLVAQRMRRVAEAAILLAERVGSGTAQLEAFAEPARNAANATELGALAALGSNGNDRLRYQLRFAQSPLSQPREAAAPQLVVTPAYQSVLADAADFLRNRQPRKGVIVSGLVVRLAREGKFGSGDVSVQGIDDDSGATRRFRINLSEPDYEGAIRAHQNGLQVLARGDIEYHGRQRQLINVSSFEVVEPLYEHE